MNELFRILSNKISRTAGSPMAFITAFSVVVVWACLGPLFNYSTTWQLFINTTTTIITFLMVFIIQNAQNRDTKAVHLKLDELLRSTKSAHNQIIDIENATEEELSKLEQSFRELHLRATQALEKHRSKKHS
ncbi:MAG: low affinity iron permease family protein [Bdellovibrionales bacterium]|nr:low affinity iron permease family protein [Bdellovibrionales bacterium]